MRLHKYSLIAVLALGSLLCGTQLSSAQDAKEGNKEGKKRGGMSAQQRADTLATRLELSAEQKTKVTTVFEAENKKIRDLRADQSTPREQQREKLRALREETAKEMKGILTPAQFEQWQKMRQELRQRAGEKKASEEKKKTE